MIRTTETRFLHMARDKARVSGTYYGEPFTGTIVSSRQLNWPTDFPEELTIKLDKPRWSHMLGRAFDTVLINSRDVCLQRNGMDMERI